MEKVWKELEASQEKAMKSRNMDSYKDELASAITVREEPKVEKRSCE